MNAKAKRTRAEHRAIRILDAAGYVCTRAGGSLGLFDMVAVGPQDVRLIQVKAGSKYLSGVEREQLTGLTVPANVSRECWRFPDRCRTPLIERL
jgi:Holliday junction resolvase